MTPVGFQLNPTFSFTLLGTFAIYMWTRPPRAAWLWVVPFAAVMRWACARTMGGLGTYFGVAWISWGTFLGIASLLVLVAQAVAARTEQRRSYMRTFYAGSVFPLLAMLVGVSVPLNIWLRPKTWDAYLLAFDGSLGFQPSFLLGKLLAANHDAWRWTTVMYYALPLAGGMLYAANRVRARRAVGVLGLLLSFMIIGFAQYGVYPATGPAHAFPEIYPWKIPLLWEIALQPMVVAADPRNCMPSLHFGAALLVWWNSRIWPTWGRALAMLFLLLTAFSTLALGEHYLADLMVAVPFALTFQAAWTLAVPLSCSKRYIPIAVGVSSIVVWLLLLRYAIPVFESSAVATWASILLTVGGCWLLELKLANEADQALKVG